MEIFSKKIFLLILFIFLLFIAGAVIFKLNSSTEKTYSTVLFSSDKTQTISLSAKLTGKGIPNTKVILYLTPNIIKQELNVDQQGNWSYTLPHSTKPGKYRLTIEILDGVGNLVSIKSYKIEIKSSSLFSLTLSNTVLAQEEEISFDQVTSNTQFNLWTKEMEKAGFKVQIEDGDILLYAEEKISPRRYCDKPDICNQLTFQLTDAYIQEIGERLKVKNRAFFENLANKIQQRGYSRLVTLSHYFPNVSEEDFEQRLGIPQVRAARLQNKTTPMPENEFRELIVQVSKEGTPPTTVGEATEAFFKGRRLRFVKQLEIKLLDIISYPVRYNPYYILSPLFPDLYTNIQPDNFLPVDKNSGLVGPIPAEFHPEIDKPLVTSIDQQLLQKLMREVYEQEETRYASDLKGKFDWKKFEQTTPAGALIELFDPIFATRVIADLFTKPGQDISGRDSFNGMIGITFLAAPTVKFGGKVVMNAPRIVYQSTVDIAQLVRETAIFRQSLKQQEALSLAYLGAKQRFLSSSTIPYSSTVSYLGRKGISSAHSLHKNPQWNRLGTLPPQRPRSVPNNTALRIRPLGAGALKYWDKLEQFFDDSSAYFVHIDEVIEPAALRVRETIERVSQRIGRNIEISPDLDSLVQGGNIIVVDDSKWHLLSKNPDEAGFAVQDLVIIQKSQYESNHGLTLIYHELFHVAAPNKNLVFDFYNKEREIDKILTLLYEIGNDSWVKTLLSGSTEPNLAELAQFSGYAERNPEVIREIVDRIALLMDTEGIFVTDALLDFAMTADASGIIRQIMGRFYQSEPLVEINKDLIRVFSSKLGINANKIQYAQTANIGQTTSQAAGVFTFPVVVISSDILSDDYELKRDKSLQVTRLTINSAVADDNQISAKFIVSRYGEALEDYTNFYDIKMLVQEEPQVADTQAAFPKSMTAITEQAGIDCSEICQISNNFTPGMKTVYVCISSKGSDKVLTCDSTDVRITRLKKITKIIIQDKELDFNNPVFIPTLDGVKDQPKSFNVPIIVQYNFGEPKYLALTINYQPKITVTPLPETTTEPESTSQPAPTEEPAASECQEEARDLGEGVARNYNVCSDGSEQPSGEEYCINGLDDPGCRLNQ